jgi:hypothetical protein
MRRQPLDASQAKSSRHLHWDANAIKQEGRIGQDAQRKKPTEGAVGKDHFERVERETGDNYMARTVASWPLLQLLTVGPGAVTAIYKSNGFAST